MNETDWEPSAALTLERPRPRVTDALMAALSQPLVLLCAAAGYGKTVAGHQLWQAWRGNRAWWTVTAADQQPDCGIGHLIGAARQAWGLAAAEHSGLAALLADMSNAPGGLLVVDDISNWPSPALWGAIGQLAVAMTPACHILLLSRHVPPLPVTLWRSQGRLQWFDHTLLLLTAAEWDAAGYDGGESACRAACGWWGAQEAARLAAATAWNPALAAWLDEAWFGPMPAAQQAVLGCASLLPDISIEELAAVSGETMAQAWSAWSLLEAHPGPLLRQQDRLGLAPAYRLYASQAWRRHDPAAWALAAQRATDYLLQRGDQLRAAQLVAETGLPELQERVLARAGWSLLYGSARELLGRLLLQNAAPAVPTRLLQCAWQIEVDKTPHLAEATLLQLLPQLTGDRLAEAETLLAAMSWQYDDFMQGQRWAGQALTHFSGNLHPAWSLALLAQASACFGLGQLAAAEPLLRRAAAHATRDGLPHLQLDILQRRALLASECGETAVALTLIGEARALAARHGLDTPRALDSSARLAAWLHLQRQDVTAARAALAAARAPDSASDDYWSFPRRLLQALLALTEHDLQGARAEIDWLGQRLSEQFHCHKWQNEAMQAQLWLAARQLDRTALQLLEQTLLQCDWAPGLHRDRRRVLLAAARLLGEGAEDMNELQQLLQRLQDQGARALSHTLALILALHSDDRNALLRCVRQGAAAGQRLDYLWLGNKSVGPLERLLSAPELIHDSGTMHFLRELVQTLLAPALLPATATDSTAEPPAGLTGKEWQILQLIGQQLTNEQIAARLFVSMATVKTHINHLYGKLGIRTRAEAVHRARSLAA